MVEGLNRQVGQREIQQFKQTAKFERVYLACDVRTVQIGADFLTYSPLHFAFKFTETCTVMCQRICKLIKSAGKQMMTIKLLYAVSKMAVPGR